MRFPSVKTVHAQICAIFLLAGCGGSKFVAGTAEAGSAGQAAAGGDADRAGAGGDGTGGRGGATTGGVGAGGAAGASAGNGGSAGKPATTCDCAAGSYCQMGTTTCRSCTDFSALEFATPEKLATLNQTGNQRFPRPASAASDLFYRSGSDGAPALWYAAAPISGVGHQLFSALDAGLDSGPLFAPKFSPGNGNFYFDRADQTTLLRQIWSATWAGGKLSAPLRVPELNGGNDDFSVAIAEVARRVYWMSSRNKTGSPQLIWAKFGAGATTPAVLDLKVKVGASNQCAALLNVDATPWVNVDGTLLLFRSLSTDDKCNVNDGMATDLFAAPLSPAGTPLAPAVPLSSLNNTGGNSSETDPALSQDACTIYFGSDNGHPGDFDLYSAVRN
ncbi:MAG: hypothetical protein ABJB12_22485 [Pseudomonadota bacterium]